MDIAALRTDIPVLLLYNTDPRWPSEDIAQARTLADQAAAALGQLGHPVRTVELDDARLDERLAAVDPDDYIVFNWCEEIPGIPHSEAQPACILEARGFTFTGADADALTLTTDKRGVKLRLDQQNIPTPPWKVYDTAFADGWGQFPAIVKPAYEHCSRGIDPGAVVTGEAQLAERVGRVIGEFRQPALVEEFICGRELTVTVMGNGSLRLLPVAEVDFSAIENDLEHIRTCESKFDKNSQAYRQVRTVVPVELPEAEHQALQAVVCAAYRAIGCRDYARLDLRLRDGAFYVVDVNHNADLSPDASVPLSALAAGITHGELISTLVNLAAGRHPRFSGGDRYETRGG
jgi:D-alanine-D-alanine ligase